MPDRRLLGDRNKDSKGLEDPVTFSYDNPNPSLAPYGGVEWTQRRRYR